MLTLCHWGPGTGVDNRAERPSPLAGFQLLVVYTPLLYDPSPLLKNALPRDGWTTSTSRAGRSATAA